MLGNGHKNNGHKKNGKRKNGEHAGLSKTLKNTKAIESDGSPTKMAKALGIAIPTAHQYLQKPEIKKLVLDARERALKAAGISRARVYKKVNEGLDATKTISANIVQIKSDDPAIEQVDAHSKTQDFIDVPDFKERRESAKLCLQLFRDLEPQTASNSNVPLVVLMLPIKSSPLDILDVGPST